MSSSFSILFISHFHIIYDAKKQKIINNSTKNDRINNKVHKKH